MKTFPGGECRVPGAEVPRLFSARGTRHFGTLLQTFNSN
jgi:hypothetical protein